VIRNAEATWQNLQIMLDAGLHPMPVFVENNTAWDTIPQFMAISPHICIAGGVKTKDAFAHQRYQLAYRYSSQQARIHALGYGRWPEFFQIPLHSADSSSYSSGSQYGYVTHYDRHRGFQRLMWRDLGKKTDKARSICDYLRHCQVSYADLSNPEIYKGQVGLPALSGLYAGLKFAAHAAEQGKLFFLAASTPAWLEAMAAVWSVQQGPYFNYPEARARYHAVIHQPNRRNTDQLIAALVDLIQEGNLAIGQH